MSEKNGKYLWQGHMSISPKDIPLGIGFNGDQCPLCGKWQAIRYEYAGIPILVCDCEKIEPDKVYLFDLEKAKK